MFFTEVLTRFLAWVIAGIAVAVAVPVAGVQWVYDRRKTMQEPKLIGYRVDERAGWMPVFEGSEPDGEWFRHGGGGHIGETGGAP